MIRLSHLSNNRASRGRSRGSFFPCPQKQGVGERTAALGIHKRLERCIFETEVMFTRNLLSLPITILLLACAGCRTPSETPHANRDPAVDFAAYRTFALLPVA